MPQSCNRLASKSSTADGAKHLNPLVLSARSLGRAPRAVLYPQPGIAIWKRENGGSIEGRATLGRALPATPEVAPILILMLSQQHRRPLRSSNGTSTKSAAALRRAFRWKTLWGAFITSKGEGLVPRCEDGPFLFAGLGLGQYYILADINWLLRHSSSGETVSSVTDAAASRTSNIAIEVWPNSSGGIPNVPR